MREIVLDTETTGLDPLSGHRIVEIGAVELVDHSPTGRTFHRYLNPERDMPADAVAVHGLTAGFLADKPPFDHVVDEFLAFLGDAPLVAHNAGFDDDTRSLQAYMGHKNIQHTVRYTELSPDRFKGFWKDRRSPKNSLSISRRRFASMQRRLGG